MKRSAAGVLAVLLLCGAGATWHLVARAEPAPLPAVGEVHARRAAVSEAPRAQSEERALPPLPELDEETRLLVYHLRHGSDAKRREVVLSLIERGPAALGALPQLLEFLTDPRDRWGRLRYEITQAAAATGAGALPYLHEVLWRTGKRDSAAAVAVLAAMGETARPLLPNLIALAEYGYPQVVAPALAPFAEDAAGPLVEALANAREDQLDAYETMFKTVGKGAARELGGALHGPHAVRALRMLNALQRESRPALADLLRAFEMRPSEGLLQVLRYQGGASVPAIASAVARWAVVPPHSPDAIQYLREVGRAAPAETAELLRRVVDATGGRDDVLLALARVTGDIGDVTPELRRKLAEGPECGLLLRLVWSGVDLSPVRPRLWEIALDSSPDTRFAAARAFVGTREDFVAFMNELIRRQDLEFAFQVNRMGRRHTTEFDEAVGHVPRRVEEPTEAMLRSEKWRTFRDGLRRLAVHPALDAMALPILRRRLPTPFIARDPSRLREFEPLGSRAAPLASGLLPYLDDDGGAVFAADMLAAIGPAAGAARPKLRSLARSAWWPQRWAALHALWKIADDRNAFRAALRDSHPNVREAAVRTAHETDDWIVSDVIGMLDDPVAAVRGWAANALGRKKAVVAVDPLRRLAADRTQPEHVRDAARWALREIG